MYYTDGYDYYEIKYSILAFYSMQGFPFLLNGDLKFRNGYLYLEWCPLISSGGLLIFADLILRKAYRQKN